MIKFFLFLFISSYSFAGIIDLHGNSHVIKCVKTIMNDEGISWCDSQVNMISYKKGKRTTFVPEEDVITCDNNPHDTIFLFGSFVELDTVVGLLGTLYTYRLHTTVERKVLDSSGDALSQHDNSQRTFYYEKGYKWPYWYDQKLFQNDRNIRPFIYRNDPSVKPFMLKARKKFYPVLTLKQYLNSDDASTRTLIQCTMGVMKL